jgi:hypothetical protein
MTISSWMTLLSRCMGSFYHWKPVLQSCSHRVADWDTGHHIGFEMYWRTNTLSYPTSIELGKVGTPNVKSIIWRGNGLLSLLPVRICFRNELMIKENLKLLVRHSIEDVSFCASAEWIKGGVPLGDYKMRTEEFVLKKNLCSFLIKHLH